MEEVRELGQQMLQQGIHGHFAHQVEAEGMDEMQGPPQSLRFLRIVARASEFPQLLQGQREGGPRIRIRILHGQRRDRLDRLHSHAYAPQTDLVARGNRIDTLDALAVQQGAVVAAQILQQTHPVLPAHTRMAAAEAGVGDHHLVGRGAAEAEHRVRLPQGDGPVLRNDQLQARHGIPLGAGANFAPF